jgi:anti-sigma regulatory factor (Ser/Thr protein kinase)
MDSRSQNQNLIDLIQEATFELKDFHQATKLSNFLAQACPTPTLADIALSELFMNAIEHGNLNLSYTEKTQLQAENRWISEIEHRLTLPQYKNKIVTVHYKRTNTELIFRIIDEGQGFDWQHIKQKTEENPNFHGRGLAIIAQTAFKSVEYTGCGNQVTCVIALQNKD